MRHLAAAVMFVAFAATGARAEPVGDTVALLPLDAGARFEIYGQPVASEIARTLVAGGIDVVVVLPGMPVPATARLVVGGSIKAGKGDTVVLSIVIRNPLDGKPLDTVAEPATALANIDRAAAELSAKILPKLREQLAALHPVTRPIEVRPPVVPVKVEPALLVGVTVSRSASVTVEPLRLALGDAVTTWTRAAHRVPRPTDWTALSPQLAPKTVAAKNAERAIAFEVLGFSIDYVTAENTRIPVARARVRVRIADASAVVFDRVVVTDTIVGDKATQPNELAARTAREILSILVPHMRRSVSSWR